MLSPNTPVDEAEVVIVGGGLLGASAAWHLTRAGVSDVLLLERNDIATGASCRSAGMFNHTRSDINSIRMISRTRQAIAELEDLLGEDVGFRQDGCVRAVFSESRDREMRELEAVMRVAGLQAREIDAREAAARVPWLELDGALRILFVPEDGYADGALLASAYLRAARKAGARVRRGVEATALIRDGTDIVGVQTSSGRIRAKWVVCAAGAWQMALAASAGYGFPGAATRSHYWITAPHGSGPARQANVYLPDFRVYMRAELGGVLLGLQEPSSRTYDPAALRGDMGDMYLEYPEEDLDLLLEYAAGLKRVVPDIDDWGFVHHITGLSVYTPDGKFVVGRPAGTSGMIVAGGCCGSGLASSGGYGEIVASIVTGQPSDIDAAAYDPNRFGAVDPGSGEFRGLCAASRASKSRGNLASG